MIEIVWTDYLRYRAALRRYEVSILEDIVRYSAERYLDVETGRTIFVGRHHQSLVLIPCDIDGISITPVTVHATTRQQIRFRLRTGRFSYEQT